MSWAIMTYCITAKNLKLNIKVRKFGMKTFRKNIEMRKELKITLIKGGIIIGQIADNLLQVILKKQLCF